MPGLSSRLFLFPGVFFFAVLASVYFMLRIGQEKDLVEFLFDRGNAARVFALDYIFYLLRKHQFFLLDDFFILDHIDCDVVINESQDVEVEFFDSALYFQDVLFPHFIADNIFEDRNRAVKLIEL